MARGIINYSTSSRRLLDASSHLYKRVCPYVRPKVRRSVRNAFSQKMRDASDGRYRHLLLFSPIDTLWLVWISGSFIPQWTTLANCLSLILICISPIWNSSSRSRLVVYKFQLYRLYAWQLPRQFNRKVTTYHRISIYFDLLFFIFAWTFLIKSFYMFFILSYRRHRFLTSDTINHRFIFLRHYKVIKR